MHWPLIAASLAWNKFMYTVYLQAPSESPCVKQFCSCRNEVDSEAGPCQSHPAVPFISNSPFCFSVDLRALNFSAWPKECVHFIMFLTAQKRMVCSRAQQRLPARVWLGRQWITLYVERKLKMQGCNLQESGTDLTHPILSFSSRCSSKATKSAAAERW